MLVYVPSTISGLRRLHERRGLMDAPTFGSAVTPYLREYYRQADDEELEYLILAAAGHDSLRLISADPVEQRRRVVIVVEATDDTVTPDPGAGPTAVQVTVEIPLARIVAVHVDGDDAVAAIEAATTVADAADRGDAAAAEVVAALEDHELLWYGAQEIAGLV